MGSESLSKKRDQEVRMEFIKRKRVRLEDYFTGESYSEKLLCKFHQQMKILQDGNVSAAHIKNITRTIRQLMGHNLEDNLLTEGIREVIVTLINFLKKNFVEDSKENNGEIATKSKHCIDITFDMCYISLFVFSQTKLDISDMDHYVNDVIFYLRKNLDKINSKFLNNSKISRFKESILENLELTNWVIKIRNFNSLNTAGIITSCIDVILFSKDSSIPMSALKIILNFFKKGEEFRAIILNLLFKSIARVNGNHKLTKNHQLGPKLSVSMFTVLIMVLIENVPVRGFSSEETQIMRHMLLKESFEDVMKTACFVVMNFVKKVADNTDGTNFKTFAPLFSHLVTELIEVSNEACWPSSRLILNFMLKPLAEMLLLKSQVSINAREFSLRVMCDIIHGKMRKHKMFSAVLESIKERFVRLDCDDDFTEFCWRSLLDHLRKRRKSGINDLCQYIYGIQWFDDVVHSGDCEIKIERLTALFVKMEKAKLDLTENELKSIVHHLDVIQHNHADPLVALKYLVYCCYDTNKRIKSPAAHYLLDLLEIDSNLLQLNMIEKLLNDPSVSLPGSVQERICSLIDGYYAKNQNITNQYCPFLLRFLDEQSNAVKIIRISLIAKLIINKPSDKCSINLIPKILGLVQNGDPMVQKQVVDFCRSFWFQSNTLDPDCVKVLLEIADNQRACKHLRYVFDELFNTPNDPPESFMIVAHHLFEKIKLNEKMVQCLQILSLMVAACPRMFVSHLSTIATPLKRPYFTKDNGVEIITAEILNFIIPTIHNPDRSTFTSLRNELVHKLNSDESLNYSMGLLVSLVKLLNKLSESDKVYLRDNSFIPSLKILKEYSVTDGIIENRTINKALCIAIHLHIYYPKESLNFDFEHLLNHFINHRTFGLSTIHCLCYLSLEYKPIMAYEPVLRTIDKYLKDRRYTLLVKAVLYNIFCSLKNIKNGQIVDNVNTKGIEDVKKIVLTRITYILDCTIDERVDIRETTYEVIRQLFASGITPEFRLVPAILLMSTDPVDFLAQIGTELLTKMRWKNVHALNQDPYRFIIASFKFRSKCLKENCIRGFSIRKEGIEAVCNSFYVHHQEEVIMRQKIVDSILRGLGPEAETSLDDKLYLADHLASFTYKYKEEVCYVLQQISAASSVTIPISEPDREIILKYYGVHILGHIKSYLMKFYGFNSEKLRRYYPEEESKKDLVQRKFYIYYDIPKEIIPGQANYEQIADTIIQAIKKKRKRKNNSTHLE